MEPRILKAAAKIAFSDLRRNHSAVVHDDHVAVVTDVEGDTTACIRVYYPEAFQRIREKLRITAPEINEELREGPFLESDLAGEYDTDCYFSARERIVLRSMSNDEINVFQEIVESYTAHILEQSECFLPLTVAFFKIETRAKMKVKSPYFMVTRSVFPRQKHDHLFFLDLKGCPTRCRESGLFLKDADVTWEHELAFGAEERAHILDCLRDDVNFLKYHNMTNYSLVVAITQRHVDSIMEGPDDTSVEIGNQGTLKQRHDRVSCLANLLPKPTFGTDHPEWEYYFGLSDVFTPFKTKAKIARAFRIALGANKDSISNMPPEEYGDRFLNFMDGTVSMLAVSVSGWCMMGALCCLSMVILLALCMVRALAILIRLDST